MKRQLTYILSLFSVISLGICQVSAQTSVGINTQTPNPNAVLELVSPLKNQGLLITSLNDAERTNLGKKLGLTESGLMIFNTSDTMFYFWSGKVWHKGLSDLSDLYEITSTLTDSSTSYYNGIQNLTFNTATNTFDIGVLKTDLALLKTAVDKLIAEQNLASILTKGNEANNKISKLTAPTDALDATNKQYVDAADANLSTEIGKTNTNVTQLTSRVTSAESTLTDHETRISTNTTNIATNATNITSVSNRVTANEATLTDYEARISKEEGLSQIVRDSIQDVYSEVLKNKANIGTLRDSVKTNIAAIDVNQTRIKELSDTAVAEIAKNNARAKASSDSINYLYKTGKSHLPKGAIYIGGANDTASTVIPSGDIAINNSTGDVQVQNGAIAPTNMAGISTNGNLGEVLVSKADGTFEWQGKFAGGMSDDLDTEHMWIGNASKKAAPVAKSAVPLSGFAPASADVSIGDGIQNYKIVNLKNPSNNQDAATKKYVDDSVSVLRQNVTNLYDSVADINNNITNLYDSVTNINQDITNLYDSVADINNNITNLYDSVTNINQDITNLYDSVADINNNITNLYDSVTNINQDITNLYDSVADINTNISNLYDSVTNITQDIKLGNFHLEKLHVFVGDAKDSAKAVTLNGAIAVVDVTGKTEVQPGVLRASNLGADVSGTPLSNGTANHILTSKGDGSFKWIDLSTTPVDPANIALSNGKLFVGNSANQAEEVAKNKIPLSGFDNATADVSMGDGVANNKITNLHDPVANQDAATKAYVDNKVVNAGGSVNLTSAHIFVGNSSGKATDMEVTGDVTLDNAGDIQIKADAVGSAELATDAVTASEIATSAVTTTEILDGTIATIDVADQAITATKINGITSVLGTTGQVLVSKGDGSFEWQNKLSGGMTDDLAGGFIWVGNGLASSKAAAVNPGGDVEIAINGSTTIQNNAVTTAKIINDAVDKDKIASDVAGNGIGQNIDGSLEVKTTGTTLELNADALRVAADGITANEIATSAVTTTEILDGTVATIDIANNAVTYGKMQAVGATSTLLGSSATTTAVQEITLGSGLSMTGSTLNAKEGTVTGVSIVSANGLAGTVATSSVTPAITLSTTVTGLLKGNGTAISAATAGTDYTLPTSTLYVGTTPITLNRTSAAQSLSGITSIDGSASTLTTPRAINGVNFDGSAPITVPVNSADDIITATTVYPLWTTVAGNAAAKISTTKLGFVPSTGILTATGFAGNLTGNVTGNVSGTAANVTGTVAVANGGTGQTTFTNGQLLIGNTTGNTLTKATLTGTTNQVVVTNGTGSITLSTPQDIATSSSPSFAGMSLSGLTASKVVFTDASKALTSSGTVGVTQGGTGLSSTTANRILYSSAANTIAELPTANGGILNTSATGVPSITATPTLGVAGTGGTLTFAGATSGTITLQPTAVAGAATVLTLPASSGTLALTNGSITTDNVPRWDGNKLINSSIWCNTNGVNTRLYLGSTTAPATYDYNLQVAGTFKTEKIYHSSDVRWKKNIQTVDNALDKIQRLRGVTYEWRTTEFPDKQFSEGTQIGLIAQEVEKVLPELVNTGTDGYKAVEYANIVSVLIEAIKEQQALIAKQEEEIAKLQADVSANAAYMQQIQTMQVQMVTMQNQIASLSSLVQLMAPTASSNK